MDRVLQRGGDRFFGAQEHANALISSNTVVDRYNHVLAPLDAARWDSVLSVDCDNRWPNRFRGCCQIV
jgi:hypothetical protein